MVEGRRCYNFQEEYVTSLDQQLDLNVIIPVCLWLKYYKKVEQFTIKLCFCCKLSAKFRASHLTSLDSVVSMELPDFQFSWKLGSSDQSPS